MNFATTPIFLHPRLERIIHSLTSVTGHTVWFDPATQSRDAQRWEVVGNSGDRYGAITVR